MTIKLITLFSVAAGALILFLGFSSDDNDQKENTAQTEQVNIAQPGLALATEYQRESIDSTDTEQVQGSIYWKDDPALCKQVADLFYQLQRDGGEEAAMKFEIETCDTVIGQGHEERLKSFTKKLEGAGLRPPVHGDYIWSDLHASGRLSVLNRLNAQVSEFQTFSLNNDVEQAFGRMDVMPLMFSPEMHLMRLSKNGFPAADDIPPKLLSSAAEARDFYVRHNAVLKQEESFMYGSQHGALVRTKLLNVPGNERELFWSTYLPEYARLKEESASCALNYVLEMQLLLDEYNL